MLLFIPLLHELSKHTKKKFYLRKEASVAGTVKPVSYLQ